MGDFQPQVFDPGPILARSQQQSRADLSQMGQIRDRSVRRAEAAIAKVVAGGKAGVGWDELIVALGDSIPQEQFPLAKSLHKQALKGFKDAEKQQTDTQAADLSKLQSSALGPGGTPAEFQNLRNRRGAATEGLSPGAAEQFSTQVEAGTDALKREAAAAAEKERLGNRSPIAVMAEEGGYSAATVQRIARDKVNNELNSGTTSWEKTELARLNAGLLTQEAYDRRQAQYQDNRLAASRGSGMTITTNPDGTIELTEGADALEALRYRKERAASEVMQDRLTNAEIADFYLGDLEEMILKHPSRAIVGGTGKVKRFWQNFQGLVADVDRQFDINLAGWAESSAMAMSEDFLKGTMSGQEMDPEVQERLGHFLKNFDADNATLEHLEYIISYNLVAMRQRGTRVSTNAAIDRQAKRLGLTSARSTDGILAALRTARAETKIIIRDINRRLKKDFNVERPVSTLPGDIPSNNPLVTDPRSVRVDPNAPVPSGPLDALSPGPPLRQQQPIKPVKRFIIEDGKLVTQ